MFESAQSALQRASSLWWNNTTAPSAFRAALLEELESGASVALYSCEKLPWKQDFFDALQEHMDNYDAYRRLEIYEASQQPPLQFFLETFTPIDKQVKYRPGKEAGAFLAEFADNLHIRYIWIRSIPAASMQAWMQIISSYLEARGDQEKAVFVLDTNAAAPITSFKGIQDFDCSNIGSWFDFHVFCSLVASQSDQKPIWKLYLSEVLSAIGQENPELTALLASESARALMEPKRMLDSIFEHQSMQSGACFPQPLATGPLMRGLWNAQLRIIFPLIEQYRKSIIHDYDHVLRPMLPIQTTYGTIQYLEDIEIGFLNNLINTQTLYINREYYYVFSDFHEARNKLAHQNTVNYNTVASILNWVDAHPDLVPFPPH